jgi:hypothetical protein
MGMRMLKAFLSPAEEPMLRVTEPDNEVALSHDRREIELGG